MPGRFLLIAVVLLLTGHAPALAQSDDLKSLKTKAQQLILIRPAEAMAAGRRALEIAEASLGPDHAQVADILAQLARIHIRQGQPADAEPLEGAAAPCHENPTVWRNGRPGSAEVATPTAAPCVACSTLHRTPRMNQKCLAVGSVRLPLPPGLP